MGQPLHGVAVHRRKELPVGGAGDIHRRHIGKQTGNGVAQGLVDASLPVRVHIQVDHHHPARRQVVPNQGKELHRGHLERDGNVLIGIHLNHVILGVHRLEVGPAVIGGHIHRLGKVKITRGQLGDLVINLHPGDLNLGKIAGTLPGIGSGAVAQNQNPARGPLVQSRHHRRRQGVVVVHPGEALLLHLHRLYPKQDIGGEDGPVHGLFHLEIVVNRLPFIGKVLFPEGKSAPAAQQGAEHKENPRRQAGSPAGSRTEEIGQPNDQQNPGKQQESHRRAHRRDGDKGGQKGPQDAADGVAGPQGPHHFAVVLQAVHRVLHQGRGHRAQQEQGKDKNDHTGAKGRNHQKVGADGEDQQTGNAQNNVLSQHGNGSDPDRRQEQTAVEPVRVGIPVRGPAAPEVAQGQGNHNGADDDGPHNLGGAEVRRQQTAGPQFHRHDGDAGKEFRQVEIILVLQNGAFFHGSLSFPIYQKTVQRLLYRFLRSTGPQRGRPQTGQTL